ncbi:hypothetical protein EGI24_18050 [Lacihabitans sp. CS3-21]|nr:hypothetical protein [Lacihabitans sp. CS3-21]
MGFLISIIDVIAVIAIRLLGNNEAFPEMTWSNILSPSLLLYHDIHRQPITLFLGNQKEAGLVKIEDIKAIIGSR